MPLRRIHLDLFPQCMPWCQRSRRAWGALSPTISGTIHSNRLQLAQTLGHSLSWRLVLAWRLGFASCSNQITASGYFWAFHMIFDCQLSRGRARALGCQRCFEVVLIRTAIRFSSTAAALPSHASSMHHDTPSEEVAVLAHAYGTGRTCLYRSAVDARLAGRLRARARGSCCGGD